MHWPGDCARVICRLLISKWRTEVTRGIITRFIETEGNGQVNLKGTVSVAGLGGNPYRDGSYQYYLSEKVVTNDPKGMGAFLLASTEMERTAGRNQGAGKQF